METQKAEVAKARTVRAVERMLLVAAAVVWRGGCDGWMREWDGGDMR